MRSDSGVERHPTTATPFGIYVHIPFCASKCGYCAFATWTDRHHLTTRYLTALRTEISRAADDGAPPATSVFVGGGTPSMVPADELAEVIAAVPVAPGAEITVECNPDDVTPERLRTLRDAGVDRVSLGVQSTSPHVLAALDRRHDPDNVWAAVAVIRDVGLRSFNLDVIYGTHGESLVDWRRTIDDVLALGPPHVSSYGLTVEAGTPLAARPDLHPDDDDQADKYVLADEALTGAGLDNYEVSNWARAGHECRHNLLYWEQGDYLGIGCAAHSHRDGRRWWNLRTPDRYLAAIEDGASPIAADERLDPDQRRIEGLQLALRTRSGVPADALDPDDLERFDGLVERRGDRIVLTAAGRLLANEIAIRLR